MDKANLRDHVVVNLGLLSNPDMTMVSVVLTSTGPIPKQTLLEGLDKVKELLNAKSVVEESQPAGDQTPQGGTGEGQHDISDASRIELDRDIANQLPNG